jgi:hypothetical protein
MNGKNDDNGDIDGFADLGDETVEAEKEAASGSAAPTYPPVYTKSTAEATEPTDEEREAHKANAGGI